MLHPLFGKKPKGNRLKKIQASPQYKNGKFRNTNNTPQLTQPLSKVLYEFFFKKSKESKPLQQIDNIVVDWSKLLQNNNNLVWFGHSSYFIRTAEKNILVDPVFSGSASPIPNGIKAFNGSDVVVVNDFPVIDYLFITHDHYDHMDYETLKQLKPKVKKVIVALGVGSHLEHWGYKPEQFIEKDWWDVVNLDDGFEVTLTPARHFSGRSIWSANTLWTSFVLKTPTHQLFLGGDSGYDNHFKTIGEKFGPFDLAILENGQYNKSWKHIHMMPEETVQAAKDLNAKVLLPIHSAKFALSDHSWYEPLERVSAAAEKENQQLITPIIGEIINLNNLINTSPNWWKKTSK